MLSPRPLTPAAPDARRVEPQAAQGLPRGHHAQPLEAPPKFGVGCHVIDGEDVTHTRARHATLEDVSCHLPPAAASQLPIPRAEADLAHPPNQGSSTA